jgi:transcriptional regulator with XRE-family HTH domain
MSLEFTKAQQVEFAERVRLFRETQGWTRERLARELGVPTVAVRRYEGAYRATAEFVVQFAALEARVERERVEMPAAWT